MAERKEVMMKLRKEGRKKGERRRRMGMGRRGNRKGTEYRGEGK